MKGKEKQKQKEVSRSRARTILYAIATCLAVAGLADATYLTVLALSGETAACDNSTGCFEVLGSPYAKVAGVPVAALGVLGYFSAFTFATFAAFNYARAHAFQSHRFRALRCDSLVALRSGLPAPCLLPILFVLGGN